MVRSWIGCAFVAAALCTQGCREYAPQPLDGASRLRAIDEQRHQAKSNLTSVDFARAASWMLETGPEVIEAVAAHRTATALADVPTPWSNPTLEVGPQLSFGPDAVRRRWIPFASLSVSVPLGEQLAATDAVNWRRSETQRTEGLVRHRELWFELRRRWTRAQSVTAVLEVRREIHDSLSRSAESTRRLVAAGETTALDVALLDLALERGALEWSSARTRCAEAQAALADLVGVPSEQFDPLDTADVATVPPELPTISELKLGLFERHGDLRRTAALYEEAEARLRLEIARQYPDLRIGPSGFGESNEDRDTVGLTLGIQLPAFDRNQQAIATAEATRDERRVGFDAAARRALLAVESAHRALQAATTRREAIQQRVVPLAARGVDLARRSFAAGTGEIRYLLEAERAHQQARIEVLDAGSEETLAWIALEAASGLRLLRFPSEHALAIPDPAPLSTPMPEPQS